MPLIQLTRAPGPEDKEHLTHAANGWTSQKGGNVKERITQTRTLYATDERKSGLRKQGEMIWQEARGMNKEWDNKKAWTLLGKRSSL